MNKKDSTGFETEDLDNDFSEFWTLEDLLAEPFSNTGDIIPGFLSSKLNMIQGGSASGKSLLASEIATSYATRTKFLGKYDVSYNPDRPCVCYIDQDTYDIKRVRDRFVDFKCDLQNLTMPKFWCRLDEEKSVSKLIAYLNHYKVGLLILDSIHAFHKLKDKRNLEWLREAFKRISDSGTAIVILSHITKGSSADDHDAARGFGLLEVTDYAHGITAVKGKYRIDNVKNRYGAKSSPFLFNYDGSRRPVKDCNMTTSELIIAYLLEVGSAGTTLVKLRKTIGGDAHVVSELIGQLPEVFCDGKKGPGSHIWHQQFKPGKQEAINLPNSNLDDNADGEENVDFPSVSGEEIPNQRTSKLDFDDGQTDMFAPS